MFTDTGTPATAATRTDRHAADTAGPQTGGPRTDAGKRIAARNATTHGLFARDVVLPHLGEDPHAYEALLAELTAQLRPRNLLERHYTEKIAAASWRLRRLHRWQAQLFEDADLPEDQVLARLDRVMRHETTLHRQIDTSVKMLGRELPKLFQDRARRDALDDLGATEDYCLHHESTALKVAERERDILERPVTPPGLDLTRLDNAPADTQDCQNEPAPATASCPPRNCTGRPGGREGGTKRGTSAVTAGVAWAAAHEKCQNEPPAALSYSEPTPFPKGEGRVGASLR